MDTKRISKMTDKNKPNFILTFSKEPYTEEQKNELVAEIVFTLLKWQANEENEKNKDKNFIK